MPPATAACGHRQAGLAGVLDSPPPMRQKRPAGDRLAVMVGVAEKSEQDPPVLNQGDEADHELAALKVAVDEAGPTPAALQFFHGVLAVDPVAVELEIPTWASSEELLPGGL